MSLQELLATKHPTAWVEFENDCITEEQLFAKFFADGRQFDGAALVNHMVRKCSQSMQPTNAVLVSYLVDLLVVWLMLSGTAGQ